MPILPPTRTISKRVGKYIEGDGSGKVVVWYGQETPNDGFFFTGEGFTDGAMKNIAPTRARRAGWAAVIVDSAAANIVNGTSGTC